MPRHALRRVALRCVALASGGGQGPRRLPVPRREHPDVSRVSELGVCENEVAVHYGGHAFRVSVSMSCSFLCCRAQVEKETTISWRYTLETSTSTYVGRTASAQLVTFANEIASYLGARVRAVFLGSVFFLSDETRIHTSTLR